MSELIRDFCVGWTITTLCVGMPLLYKWRHEANLDPVIVRQQCPFDGCEVTAVRCYLDIPDPVQERVYE